MTDGETDGRDWETNWEALFSTPERAAAALSASVAACREGECAKCPLHSGCTSYERGCLEWLESEAET